MDLEAFGSWLERYFAAWISNDPDDVASLFAADAVYFYGPFRPPARGREEIVRAWVQGGVPAELETRFEPIAVEGGRGVAHWNVTFRGERDRRIEVDGILMCTFDGRGRCTEHREWFDRREANG